MGVDGSFAYRAIIRRDLADGADPYGQPNAGDVRIIASQVPCYYWFRDENVNDNARDTVILETVLYAAFPFTVELRHGDVVEIYDRQDRLIVDRHRVEGEPARQKRYRRARLRRYHGKEG